MRSTILTFVGTLLFSAFQAPVRAEIAWNENLRNAHQQAEQEGKLLLLHFYTDNCHWCDKLESGAFQSPQLASAIGQHYIPVKIHGGKNPTLAKTFKVSRYPTDVIVSTDGSVLAHGVSPQETQAYVGMLARYAPQAPAAANPLTPSFPEQTQIANSPATAATNQDALASNSAATINSAATNRVGPTPQINQFALNPPPQPQANPYAPPMQTQPQYRGFADGQRQSAAASAQLALPTGNAAPPTGNAAPPTGNAAPPTGNAAPPTFASSPGGSVAAAATNTPAQTAYSLPPGMSGPTPAKVVGHRTNEMTLSHPGLAAPEDDNFAQPEADDFASDQSGDIAQSGDNAQASDSASEPPVLAMQGYCPVAVLEDKEWVAGDPQLGLIHLGQLYLFSSSEAMEKFRQTPEVYSPVMNGIDVVLFFEERRLVQGSREWGVTDPEFNRMFFFANEETMNHFYQEHSRYTRSAIDITRQAALEANSSTR